MSRVTESDERKAVEAAQQDPGRFAELYEQNFPKVYAYIACRVQDRSQTQDLTAHVFQQALANIGKFKWRGAAVRRTNGLGQRRVWKCLVPVELNHRSMINDLKLSQILIVFSTVAPQELS